MVTAKAASCKIQKPGNGSARSLLRGVTIEFVCSDLSVAGEISTQSSHYLNGNQLTAQDRVHSARLTEWTLQSYPFLAYQAAFRSDESESVFWTGAIGMERAFVFSVWRIRPTKKLTYIRPPENSSAAAHPISAT